MKLIIGLGNPGTEYQLTRHNFGFLALEELAKKHQLKWQERKKEKAETCEFILGKEKIILARPLTFMNDSGFAVANLKRFYKIKTENIVIIYDDLDLDFGKIKISYNRSAGGHNGVSSIIQYLKSKEFIRLRLGIAPQKGPAEKFVLQKFSVAQKKQLTEIIDTSHLALENILKEGKELAANKYN
ncbi:aminoacyl-tRNA hydrolase [Candidatus Nomurabacteria bacterium]|nr:aminoacyl-tRNA hydrolase [Candidatus Nomurabacteria bacterium]